MNTSTKCQAADPDRCLHHGVFTQMAEVTQLLRNNTADPTLLDRYFELRTRAEGLSQVPVPTLFTDEIAETTNLQVFNKVAKGDSLWEASPYKAFYETKNGKLRGSWGEHYLRGRSEQAGILVEKPGTTHFDLRLNGIRVEIKTNGSDHADHRIALNWAQIRPAQSYDYLIGQVVTPQEVCYYVLPHAELQRRAADGSIKNQHGGKEAESGTYVLSSREPAWVKPYRMSFDAMMEKFREESKIRES